ncbi:MAG TPA: PQQ-dependent dehydrogenase, methanol/ethanol family [Terriglobia bacterium]|nr:PQQ-dependent dehydrogenase, methanol/ethanol family [Terriglobia bacterium]
MSLYTRLAGVTALTATLTLSGCGGREDAAGNQQAAKTPAAVNAARLVGAAAEPGQWMSHGRTYDEQRFSPLDQIKADNVKGLGLAWFADLDTHRGQEATPIEVDGVLYISTAWSKVLAFNATTGEKLWDYDPKVPGGWAVNACCDVVNRGVAVWEGKVFVGTLDGRLVALDAGTGKMLWEVNTIDQTKPYTITGAPRVVKGHVLIGNGGAEFGVRGYVTAYDAATGKMDWRFYTVPGNPKDGFENPILETAARTWAGEWWTLGGGGTVWDSMSYDPDLDLLYIGVGNGSPWNRTYRSQGKGDNLFLASIVALRPDDGSYVWHYQTSPGESWDHTAAQQMILADLEINGAKRRVLMQAPKNGFFYVLDAKTGELISANNFTAVSWATGIDMKTGRPLWTPEARYDETGKLFRSLQNPNGAHTWHSMSYSPLTGLVYIPIHHANFVYGNNRNFKPTILATNVGADFSGNAPANAKAAEEAYASVGGRLIAWDPIAQKEVWGLDRMGQANGGALSTAGNLVFQGTGMGEFMALNAQSGEQLWSTSVQTGVLAAPISYEVGGKQYVAIMVGSGGSWGMIGGEQNIKGNNLPNISRLLVFALDGKATLPPAPPKGERKLEPPPATAPAATVAAGAGLYGTYCGTCHGAGTAQMGILPDLRYSEALKTADAWSSVVLGGALEDEGMASFKAILDNEKAEAIRAFVIAQANAAAH